MADAVGADTSLVPPRAPAGRADTATAGNDPARPPNRVLRLLRESCAVVDCPNAVEYLAGRHLWPLPAGCTLRAHVAADYFEGGQRVGRFPALLAEIRDEAGDLVTVHVTYLHGGRKLEAYEPRKLLSPLTGRTSCAVRLMRPDGEVLGVGEGLESCLAAAALHGLPVWSVLNTAVLAKFEPPAGITRLVVFADRDVPGLESAARLVVHLQGRVQLEIRTPSAPANDWADVLAARSRAAWDLANSSTVDGFHG